MDDYCSAENWASARAAMDGLAPSPVPLQVMETMCTPPHEMTWQENVTQAGMGLCLLVLVVYVFKLRDQYYD